MRVGALVLLLGVFGYACSAGNSGSSSSGDGPGSGGAGGEGGSSGPFMTGSGGGTTTGNGCSPDLKSVLDPNGNVLQTCPPDQGCAGGMCVPACDAAAASQGNMGCDFVAATPHFFAGCCGFSPIAPPCFAVFVTNNWDKEARLLVSRDGVSYDPTTFGRIASTDPNPANWPPLPATGVPQGEVAVLFLSDDPASVNGGTSLTCPVPPAVRAPNGTAIWPGDGSGGTARGMAWHIVSDAPVSAYDILPFGGAASFLPSAQLLFPTSAWGDNYLAVLPLPSMGPPWGQVVAAQDGTTVQILPSVALPGGTNVTPAPANTQASFTLNAGEYIQWQGSEMTGSVIQSDKPVAFIGGDAYQCYSSLTSSGGGCDSGHQMTPPVRALGQEYIAPPFRSRGGIESIPYRIVGAVDGTALSYEPAVPGAPATLSQGQSVTFESTIAFRVTSQDEDHPFYIAQVMPGYGCIGDEDFVNLLPPAQWLSRYVFYTDYSYPTTNLVVVRMDNGAGFQDVSIDCLGAISGWQPIGNTNYQITNVDLMRDGVSANGMCANGPHTAESQAPFGLMVWGLSSCASYAYPAGGNAATINQVVLPPVPE